MCFLSSWLITVELIKIYFFISKIIDVIESSSNYNNNTNNIKRNSRDNLNASKNNNYATIIKRRANSPRSTDINLNDSAYLTTQSDDSNQTNDLSPIQYDDITDVQIIAKLQEESLRQSVLKHHQQSIVDQQQQQQPFHRGGYSTATITKRVNPMRLTSNINVDSHDTINARRDSASSSEHSSFSSNVSNFESPYISQSNFNGKLVSLINNIDIILFFSLCQLKNYNQKN